MLPIPPQSNTWHSAIGDAEVDAEAGVEVNTAAGAEVDTEAGAEVDTEAGAEVGAEACGVSDAEKETTTGSGSVAIELLAVLET